MKSEPILREEDLQKWAMWKGTCLAHSMTSPFLKKLDASKKIIEAFSKKHPGAILSWSLGKDSTAMIHLAMLECGVQAEVFIMMDDEISFPGSHEYIEKIEAQFNFKCTQLYAGISVIDWIVKNKIADPCSDFHTKSSEIIQDTFFIPIDNFMKAKGYPGTYLGLRAEESKGRRMNRRVRGAAYLKKNGEAICTPIVDWKGKDVYAYLFSRDIDPFHVYKCCGFYSDPSRIRLDGWLAGEFSAQGEVAWLRHYYPSIYLRLASIMKGASQYV